MRPSMVPTGGDDVNLIVTLPLGALTLAQALSCWCPTLRHEVEKVEKSYKSRDVYYPSFVGTPHFRARNNLGHATVLSK